MTSQHFCAAALGSNEFKTSLEDLDRYFTYFALVARANALLAREEKGSSLQIHIDESLSLKSVH